MIKNDRQYQLSRGHLKAFEDSLRDLEGAPTPSDVDPGMLSVFRGSIESQRERLLADLEEYEALREGRVSHFKANSFAELPNMLIRARIAQKLNQRELAERLNVKEQQVQRWEANDYAGASLETLRRVVDALGIEMRKDLFVPDARLNPKLFLRNLVSAGIPKEFFLRRLLPSSLAAVFEEPEALAGGFREVFQAASVMADVFSVPLAELLKPTPPTINLKAVASARFKLPARTKKSVVNAYTVYAHYLAGCLVSCVTEQKRQELPTDWHQLHQALSSRGEPISFTKVLDLAWNCGVIVLPLRDSGAFHGAVWKISDFYVVVLKQVTKFESRWLYDLIHELGHISHKHVTGDQALLEDSPISPEHRENSEEEVANEWAEEVLFDGESREIEHACEVACGGKLQRLKAVLPGVAQRYNVNPGSLANHMAYRLSIGGENWWGAADNLQQTSSDPFEVARGVLLRRVNLRRLSPSDRELLMRALTESD